MEQGDFGHLCMQSMTEKALDMADLSFERAFAIDQSNMAKTIEDYSFMGLVESFYKKVYADDMLR